MASWMGFPSVTPQMAVGLDTISALCSRMIVSKPASPGATILGPPLKPAKKWGSTNPVVIRTSASSQWRFNRIGMPLGVSPASARPDLSKARWLTTR